MLNTELLSLMQTNGKTDQFKIFTYVGMWLDIKCNVLNIKHNALDRDTNSSAVQCQYPYWKYMYLFKMIA